MSRPAARLESPYLETYPQRIFSNGKLLLPAKGWWNRTNSPRSFLITYSSKERRQGTHAVPVFLERA